MREQALSSRIVMPYVMGIIIYTLKPTPATLDGVYAIRLNALLYPQIANCAGEMELDIGNVHPVAPLGFSCINANPNGSGGLDSHGFIDGLLFGEIAGMTNSTDATR
jgi:hypothetical protein